MDGSVCLQAAKRVRIFLGCREVRRSVAFYQALLGVAFRWLDGAWRVRLAGEEIELGELPHQELIAGAGNSDFELGVPDPDGTLHRLQERGFRCIEMTPNLFLDPDGRRIRIISIRSVAEN